MTHKRSSRTQMKPALDRNVPFHEAALRMYREHRREFKEEFAIRIYRALSWLNEAYALSRRQVREAPAPALSRDTPVVPQVRRFSQVNLDLRFITMWVAFNAAYGDQIKSESGTAGTGDRASFVEFLQRVCSCDRERLIYRTVWHNFSTGIRLLMDNPFCHQQYWNMLRGRMSREAWVQLFNQEQDKLVKRLVSDQDAAEVLKMVFERLYTIRNQLVHGGSTCHSGLNRRQLITGCSLLEKLLPPLLIVMMRHSDINWGELYYPVVKE